MSKTKEPDRSNLECKDIFAVVQFGLIAVDLETLLIIDVNPYFADMIGLPEKEIIGRPCHSIVCGKSKKECFYSNEKNPVKNSGEIELFNRKTNKRIPVLKSATKAKNIDGRNIIVEGFVNLEKIKNTEMQLRESEERFRLLFDHSSDAVLVLSENKKIIDCNRAALKMFGYLNKREFMSIEPKKIILHKDNKLLKEDSTSYIQELNVRGKSKFQAYHFRKDGTQFLADVAISKVCIMDNRVFQIILHDITDQNKYEEELKIALIAAERGNRAKSEFLANVSHELRTPLQPIIGYASTILDEWRASQSNNDCTASEDVVKMLMQMQNSGKDLLRIINDILDLSKIESGRLEIINREFFLPEAVHSVVAMMRKKAERKGLELQIKGNLDEMNHCVIGDPDRIRQVLLNLVSNAIKFTNAGHVIVNVSVETPENSKHSSVTFMVIDTGIGIPKEMIHTIFKPFEKIGGHRNTEGTGLGLTICDNLIEEMGVEPLKVESVEGLGSKFYFVLEMEHGGEYPICSESADECSFGYVHKLNILVAEDMEHTRILAGKFLDKYNHTSVLVSNGVEALEAIRKEMFDIVLLDIKMPVMDGVEAARTMRIRGYETPLIAFTASAFDSDKEECLNAGMNGFIPKPVINPASLNSMIVEVYERFRLKIFDEEKAVEMHGGDRKLLLSGIDVFFRNIHESLDKIKKHSTEKNWKKLVNSAHTIKGSASQLAFNKIKQAALNLELSAKVEDEENIDKLIVELENQIKIAGEFLNR